ncbi:MAG: hypothetical protein AB1640_17355 [bacterium]
MATLAVILTGLGSSPAGLCTTALAADSGQTITAEGDGEASVETAAGSQAQAQALDDALRHAFEKALLEILPQTASLETQDRVVRELAANKKAFLLSYRVLSEMPTEKVYFVTAEATFSSALIRRALSGIEGTGMNEAAAKGTEMLLRVEGVTSFQWFEALRRYLREGPGVRSVQPLEVNGTTVVLSVAFAGRADELVQRLASWAPERCRVRVNRIQDREIWVMLTPAESDGVVTESVFPSSPVADDTQMPRAEDGPQP